MIYFFSMGAPLVFAYALQSLHARVLPNWIAPAVVPLFLLMVLYWDPFRQRPWVRRLFRTGLFIGLIGMIFLTDTDIAKIITGQYLPMSMNPLRRVRGWRDTARVADKARQNLSKEGKPVFIICPDYGSTSEMIFYLPEAKAAVPGSAIVYFWDVYRPVTEFYYWPECRYQGRVGDNAIFINLIQLTPGESHPTKVSELTPKGVLRQFRSVKNIGMFHGDFRGRPVRWFQLFECRDLLADIPPPEAGK